MNSCENVIFFWFEPFVDIQTAFQATTHLHYAVTSQLTLRELIVGVFLPWHADSMLTLLSGDTWESPFIF